MKNSKLEKLWLIAESEAERKDAQPKFVFDPIGLILIRPLKQEEYDSTPVNSIAFASTGGEGVHFSLLQIYEEVSHESPVVMTVPMNYGNENLIVGSSIWDFLCFGCEVGFSFLELLTYGDSKSDAVYWLTHPEEWLASLRNNPETSLRIDDIMNLLNLLRSEFDLRPWENIEENLQSLGEKYFSLLELRPE
jgi:hypothetical protein